MKKLLIIFGGIFLIWYLRYYSSDNKINEKEFIQGIIIITISFIISLVASIENIKKKQSQNNNTKSEIFIDKPTLNEDEIYNHKNIDEKNIHTHCPHCKSPNSKKMEVCEWCGNQII
jgi:hypothetical protein